MGQVSRASCCRPRAQELAHFIRRRAAILLQGMPFKRSDNAPCLCRIVADHTVRFPADLSMNILLAEDNDNDVLLLQAALKGRSEVSLHVVHDGEEVIQYLQGEAKYADREKFPLPSLLLLDIKMPKKNGFEVIQWIRNQPTFNPLPVIMLTTSQLKEDIDQAYRYHVNSYLCKSAFMRAPDRFNEIIAYWQDCCKAPNLAQI